MDSIFIFGLALILFGPKKLPEIGRQIGKIVLEFRKASNEFKMQIEDELRAAEQADRQKKIAEETAALTAGVIPVAAAVETSTPSALTIEPEGIQSPTMQHPIMQAPTTQQPLNIQPPSTGEQVSFSPPDRKTRAQETGEQPGAPSATEQLAAVIVDSPGEDPNPDAIADIYPAVNASPATAPSDFPSNGVGSSSEVDGVRVNSAQLDGEARSQVPETVQAPPHHG